ncbi:MAG: hypothetical protein V1724_06290, partial [Chloroflexota bacterium]
LEWNIRAQRCFEKCGFTPAGAVNRNGWKLIRMELSKGLWSQVREARIAELQQAGDDGLTSQGGLS